MKIQKGAINITVVVFIVLIAILMVGAAWYYESNKEETTTTENVSITTNTNGSGAGGGPMISFLDCEAAGYPVMESHPRKCTGPDGEVFTEDIGNEIAKADLIKISKPRPNDTIVSPATITGQARGTWFFEGEFTIYLEDVLGNTISQASATAEGDWMTEDFVSFSAALTFDNESSGPGKLYLNKANPSDDMNLSDSLIVPVDFGLYAD